MDDTYYTIHQRTQHEIKARGSRFLAEVVPVEQRSEAEEALTAIRKEFHDATHHCYAYRIGSKGELYRIHDDGEPGGTAGRPILTAIDRLSLTNVLVVVTRYFGGTKLGVGGLARAYGEAAELVLQAAGRKTCYIMTRCDVRFPHECISAVMRLVSHHQAKIVETHYAEQVSMRLEIRTSMAERLRADLVESTRGQLLLDPP